MKTNQSQQSYTTKYSVLYKIQINSIDFLSITRFTSYLIMN